MKRVVVLGSTGSIGTQTLDVISQHPDRLQVVGLAAGSNEKTLREQAARFGVKELALFSGAPQGDIPTGMEALTRLATLDIADIVVVSVAGVIGLLPTLSAIEAGKHIALASKEVLVAAGEVVMPLIKKHQVLLTPIDSEHSALFQCLEGATPDKVENLILTASGGPFRGKKRDELAMVTVQQALNHPTWSMGGKITVDSATLMNKGLEMIEARWLFDIPMERIQVLVHPQSIVHSMVRFKDGSVLAQMGWPNMRLPITYALLYPERKPNPMRPWDPVESGPLHFEHVDETTFRALGLAREAAARGGTTPCAMNASNEEAANSFLRGEISFLEILDMVEQTVVAHQAETPTLDALLQTDVQARAFVRNLIGTR